MTAEKPIRSWDILRDPNRILLEEDYGSKMELLIYTLTWAVEMGLCFALAISFSGGNGSGDRPAAAGGWAQGLRNATIPTPWKSGVDNLIVEMSLNILSRLLK